MNVNIYIYIVRYVYIYNISYLIIPTIIHSLTAGPAAWEEAPKLFTCVMAPAVRERENSETLPGRAGWGRWEWQVDPEKIRKQYRKINGIGGKTWQN